MPLWATILTVCFAGIVALIAIINLFRSATKESIQQLVDRLDRLNGRFGNLEQRIDRHLEGHP